MAANARMAPKSIDADVERAHADELRLVAPNAEDDGDDAEQRPAEAEAHPGDAEGGVHGAPSGTRPGLAPGTARCAC